MAPPPYDDSNTHPPFPDLKSETEGEYVPPTGSTNLASSENGAAAPARTSKPKKPRTAKRKMNYKNTNNNNKPRQKTNSTPLPATVEVQGYEITIPNLKKNCWRVHVLHGCGHPVPRAGAGAAPSQLEAGLAENSPDLVVEVNKHHLHPCTEKCEIETTEHLVEGTCGGCSAGP